MGIVDRHSIQGRVRLILREIESGRVVEERAVKNAIMTRGSELVARRFCGEPMDAIAAVGVGTDDSDPEDGNLDDLKGPVVNGEGIPERAAIQLPAEGDSCVSIDPATHSATARFMATFDTSKGNGALVEAGVFNSVTDGVLYNRVTFPAVNKTDAHELTLIWEVTFSAPVTPD
jgi:hypothetical protein